MSRRQASLSIASGSGTSPRSWTFATSKGEMLWTAWARR
jgi:hypothetical protein